MRSKMIVSLLCVLLLLFAGCSVNGTNPPADPSEDANTTDAPSSAPSEAPIVENEDGIEENRFFNSSLAAVHDDVIYFTEETPARKLRLTYVYDCKTGEVMPLCANPECSHDSTGCMAYYPSTLGDLNYAFYNGELYFIGDLASKNGNKAVNVYACKPDGTNRRVAARLDWEYDALACQYFGIYDGTIYRGGMGSYVSGGKAVTGALVYSQEMSDGSEPKEIFRTEEEIGILICALAPGKLYFAMYEQNTTPIMRLYEYDTATDELKQLFSGEAPYHAYRISALEDRLVFHESHGGLFFYMLDTGEIEKLELDDAQHMAWIGDNSIYVGTSYTGYQCLDLEGRLLYEGERDPSLFHEEKQTKQYLGCSNGRFYSVYSSSDYRYFVVYDSNTDTWTVPWEAEIIKD